LQAVIFGYGGIRLTLDQLEIKPRGHLPNQTKKLVLHGLKYQGAELDVTIDTETYEVVVRAQQTDVINTLVYEHVRGRGQLKLNDRLVFPIDSRLIIRRAISLCP
jgi:trehalose/maltose hydrolase-like predicted phosphorylase